MYPYSGSVATGFRKTDRREFETKELMDLYWLAYLITGDRDVSAGVAEDALDAETPHSFFRKWMTGWSRKIFIAKVLDRCRNLPDRPIECDSDLPLTGKAALERALLSIDRFNRWAVLLTVFEKLPLEDAALLLNAELEEVEAAKTLGLIEMARYMAPRRAVSAVAAASHDSLPCPVS